VGRLKVRTLVIHEEKDDFVKVEDGKK